MQPTGSGSGADSAAGEGSGSDVGTTMGGRRGCSGSCAGRAAREEDQGRDCDWERDLIRSKRKIDQIGCEVSCWRRRSRSGSVLREGSGQGHERESGREEEGSGAG